MNDYGLHINNGHSVACIRYANDKVLLSNSTGKTKVMLNKLDEEGKICEHETKR